MNARTTLKTVLVACAVFSLPMSAMAGAGHIWSKKQIQAAGEPSESLAPNSAVEEITRNWAQIDFDRNNQISATEIQDYLNGKTAVNNFDTTQLPTGLTGLDDQGPQTLSSTDVGMHYAHGEGKDNPSAKVYIPGASYTEVIAKEKSNNKDFNKRAMVLEVQEAMLEKEDKAM
ncbi:MAG: hypothetical protein ABL878_04960 [Burkholderiales bacterium]